MMGEFRKIYPLLAVFAFMLVFSSVIVTAQNDNLLIRINPIHDEISIYDEALFNISITNLDSYRDTVSIYSPNIDSWSIRINPDTISIGPNRTANIILRIKPKAVVSPGMEYGVQLNFKSSMTSGFKIVYAFVNVKTQEQINREYLPILGVDIPEIGVIDPTKQLVITVDLENKNVRDLKGLEMYMRSSNIFEQKAVTDLGPLQKKSVQFTPNIPSSTPAQKSNIIFTLRLDNNTILSRSVDYEIMGVEMQDYALESTYSFMMVTNYVTIMNKGNLKTIGEFKQPTNLLNYFFIRGDAKSKLTRINGRFYKQFYVELQPGDNYNLKMVVSYRPILYVIISLLILISLYYLFRSPIVIRKSVSSIIMKEGSLSELKILLHIKNRTKRNFDDLIILDRIPKITEIKKDFEMGTIKPTKVMMHDKKGTIVRWDINSLDCYEERVIAYKLFSNLNILGGLTLPLAMLKYPNIRGKEKKITSNRIKLVIQKFTGERKE
jgi:hypothetical protein